MNQICCSRFRWRESSCDVCKSLSALHWMLWTHVNWFVLVDLLFQWYSQSWCQRIHQLIIHWALNSRSRKSWSVFHFHLTHGWVFRSVILNSVDCRLGSECNTLHILNCIDMDITAHFIDNSYRIRNNSNNIFITKAHQMNNLEIQ